jgi:Na+/H+ antiporter NhaC
MYRLSPLILFLLLYLGTSTLLRDFYSVPIAVAFLLSAIYSLITPVGTYKQHLAAFTSGVGDSTVGLMLLIFILSGAFAATAKAMGAVDSTVNMTLQLMPRSLLLPGIFLASCFISFSIGTSCGTIAALTPVAVGLATATGVSVPLMVGLVVGGTYFGDNLSFISDTTIIATQTQGCRMRDKFLTNIRIVMPCALLLMIVYYFIGRNIEPVGNLTDYSFLKILPYLCVIALALMGVDVIIVLVIGLFSTFLIGTLQGSFTPLEWLHKANDGILGMAELILCTLLASGMLAVIRDQGGIKYIITKITRHVSGSRGAEMAIAMLVFLVNICTANNTVAIITVGSISHEIAERFGIDPRRSASILDTMSCFAQGILPYGAQVLIAAGLASINPVEIIPYLYYPVLIGIAVIVTILMKRS